MVLDNLEKTPIKVKAELKRRLNHIIAKDKIIPKKRGRPPKNKSVISSIATNEKGVEETKSRVQKEVEAIGIAKEGEIGKYKSGKLKKTKVVLDTTQQLALSMDHQSNYARVIVINEKTGCFGYRDINTALIPENTIPILDNNVPTYLLGFTGEKLWAIDYMPNDNEDKTPQDCFEASCWDELEVIFTLAQKWAERIQLGILVGFGVGLLIILFLIIMAIIGR